MQTNLAQDSMERFYLDKLMHGVLSLYGERRLLIIPEESFTPAILAEFGISLSTFKKAFEAYKFDFVNLWISNKNSRFALDQNARTVIDGSLTFRASHLKLSQQNEGVRVNYVTIDGFISNPDLDELIKNYEPSRYVSWKWPETPSYLHSKAVQKLFDDLGIVSFDEIFPTEVDVKDFTGKMELYVRSKQKQTGEMLRFPSYTPYVQKNGNQTIYVLDRDREGRPLLSEVPDLILRELRVKVENRKNPVGKAYPHKDLFKKIVTTDLEGRDLIKACNVSQEINEECNRNNFQLYKDRLAKEFDIRYYDNMAGYPDARTLYIQLHTSFTAMTGYMYELIDSPDKLKALRRRLRFIPSGIIRLPPYKDDSGKYIRLE